MRRSPRINFSPSGYSLDEVLVTGFNTSIQNLLVGIGTVLGTDMVYPDKGTTLRFDLLNGAGYSADLATQMTAIATSEVQFFSVQQDTTAEINDAVRTAKLEPAALVDRRLTLNLTVTSYGGAETKAAATL